MNLKTLLEEFSYIDKRLSCIDENENMIAVKEAWTYISETGMIMSEYFADGSPRENICGKKQKIEMLYLISGDLRKEEYEISDEKVKIFPLPLTYSVGEIVCQDNVFTISSKEGNPSICGSYDIIKQQLSSAAYSYYTRGLASNVLERYYYEFLAESHQLYLEEEMFKKELKERKKRKKDLKKKIITEENFHKNTIGEYTCEQKISIWGVTTTLYTNFKENLENKEWILKEYIEQLNEHISWIEKHKKEIEKELLKSNIVETANAWFEGRKIIGEDGQSYYELDDGEFFPFPITENTFLENLFIEGIHISSDNPEMTLIQLFLDTVPNFFAYHSIEMYIYVDTDIKKTARINKKYKVHVGGLAG